MAKLKIELEFPGMTVADLKAMVRARDFVDTGLPEDMIDSESVTPHDVYMLVLNDVELADLSHGTSTFEETP